MLRRNNYFDSNRQRSLKRDEPSLVQNHLSEGKTLNLAEFYGDLYRRFSTKQRIYQKSAVYYSRISLGLFALPLILIQIVKIVR